MEELVAFDINKDDNPKIIKVIGVGGGGTNAVNYMYDQGINDVTFAVCNTDTQHLKRSPVPVKLQLGVEGLGTGMDPEKARHAAEEGIEQIKALLSDDTKMVFITAGMGNGTGTGASSVIARVAKEKDILTVGIVTIPFLFEGDNKIDMALDGVEEMSKFVDALLIINNEKLFEVYPNLNMNEAFDKANETLLVAAKSISDIITQHGKINIDFNDVRTMLHNSGVAFMSTGHGDGDDRINSAIEAARHSPLLNNNNMFDARNVLFNITYSPEYPLIKPEVETVEMFMKNFNKDYNYKFGIMEDPSLGTQVKVTLVVSGFGIEDINMEQMDERLKRRGETDRSAEEKREKREERKQRYYGDLKQSQAQPKLFVFDTPDSLYNDTLIALLDDMPVYNRDSKDFTRLKKAVSATAETDSLTDEKTPNSITF
jgi:cell division protein FtsZ